MHRSTSLTSMTITTLFLAVHWQGVAGHGRLIEPPSRASMWRFGYDSPPDYHDNQLWCGGFTVQWQQNGGQCGVCGDVWNSTEPRDHELGGRYSTGTIVRRYKSSGIMNVIVELTATHGGYFEFRLCSLDSQPEGRDASWDCLNRHQLNIQGSKDKRYIVNDSRPMKHQMAVELPAGLECAHCVFQWKYNTGNSWGQNADGKSCLGCGPQEQFFGCADVAVGKKPKPQSIKSKSSTVRLETRASRAMTTAFQLIQTTTPLPKIAITAVQPGVAVTSVSAALLTRLHDQRHRGDVQTTTVIPYQLMLSTTSYRSTTKVTTSNRVERTRQTSTVDVSSPQPTIPRRNEDEVVEHRHETTFAGQKVTMVVYSRGSRQEAAAEAARNISYLDLVEIDREGSLFVVPAWYVVVDQVTKQVNVIEPKLLAEITDRLASNRSR